MIATYHNHSTYSDGTGSVAEMIAKAAELGVDELGISDHLLFHPAGETPHWAMPLERFDDYVRELLSYRGMSSPVVRLGLEVDWFPGQAETIRGALEGVPFDYLIGSVHEVDGFRVDLSADRWDRLTVDERNERHRQYWRNVRSMAESGLFDIVAHLDLPKKFGHRQTVDLDDVINEALDAVAQAGLVVEVNTAGWHKPCLDGYPAIDLLKQCRQRDIAVTISSDAHEPDHILRDFPRAVQRLTKAGYEQVARFAERQVSFEHIEAAVERF